MFVHSVLITYSWERSCFRASSSAVLVRPFTRITQLPRVVPSQTSCIACSVFMTRSFHSWIPPIVSTSHLLTAHTFRSLFSTSFYADWTRSKMT